MVFLAVQNEDFAETKLTAKEMGLFTAQWNELFLPSWNLERRYINEKLNSVVLPGIQAAKNALDEKTFGGFNAGNNEIGISPIRPGHVGLVHSATIVVAEADQVWRWARNTAAPGYNVGYENWIHSPTTATTSFQVYRDEFVLPMYIVEEAASPKIQSVKLNIGRTDILYYDVAANRIRDNVTGISLIPLPTTFWLPETDALIALQCTCAGTIAPRLGGFTVALGSFLDGTTYTISTNTVNPSTVAAT